MAWLFRSSPVRGETIRGLFADIVEADSVVDDGLLFLGDTFFTAAMSLVIVVDPETSAIENKFIEEKNVRVFFVHLLLLLKPTMHKL